jgi:hypothetical protein
MPNDAKLGLLIGVIGVIVAAALPLSRPPSGVPSPQAAALAEQPHAVGSLPAVPSSPTAQLAEPAASPVVRTKVETDARPTSRQPGNYDIDP